MKKKRLSYLLISIAVLAAALLFYAGQHYRPRILDERVSLRKHDKIPYGTFVAYNSLGSVFPGASVTVNDKEPGNWDSLSVYDKKQALIIVCPEFKADASEMKSLISFAGNGNNVFISTMNLSYEVTEILNCDIYTAGQLISYFGNTDDADTLTVSLAKPPFTGQPSFTYPGKRYEGYFSRIDTTITSVLGYDKKGHPDFIQLQAGNGSVFIHLAPMAFTNYFLLHKENFPYYENMLSMIPAGTKRVAWDEYFIRKKDTDKKDDERGWLSTLLGIRNSDGRRSFAAAFWILLLLLVIYVLMEMRRKQRYIPVVKKPQNDSLDFVKTIGRLYHDKGDHLNLCRKMSAYFLEHVRNRYKVPTAALDEKFTKALQAKTGVPEDELSGIVYFIKELEHSTSVSAARLISFHHQLESFYKKE